MIALRPATSLVETLLAMGERSSKVFLAVRLGALVTATALCGAAIGFHVPALLVVAGVIAVAVIVASIVPVLVDRRWFSVVQPRRRRWASSVVARYWPRR